MDIVTLGSFASDVGHDLIREVAGGLKKRELSNTKRNVLASDCMFLQSRDAGGKLYPILIIVSNRKMQY